MRKVNVFLFIIIITFVYGCSTTKSNENDTAISSENNQIENDSKLSTKKNGENKSEYDLIVEKAKIKGATLKNKYASKEQMYNKAFTDVEIASIEDVVEKTEIGISGVVVNSEPFIYKTEDGNSGYTKVTIFVNEVIEGDQTLKDTEIVVYEAGGLITKAELGMGDKDPTLTTEQLKEQVVVNFDGVANFLPGTEIAAFLVKLPKESLGIDIDFYQFVGNHLTRFDKNEVTEVYEVVEPIDESMLEETITKDEKLVLGDEVTELVVETQQ